MPRVLRVLKPGLTPYDAAWAYQRALANDMANGKTPPGQDTLILLEHPPVITIGRRGNQDEVLFSQEALGRRGVELRETNRGGAVTWHGPGQLVGYPVFDLNHHGRDVHSHMRRIEAALIAALATMGVTACRREGLTGVWVQDRKIASIGVAISHWITYHGFALNIDPDLSHFDLIVPCGLKGVVMTSVRRETGQPTTVAQAAEAVITSFLSEFSFDSAAWQEGPLPEARA